MAQSHPRGQVIEAGVSHKAVTLKSFPAHLCKLICLVCPGEEEGETVVLFRWKFSILTMSRANIRPFRICVLKAGVARVGMAPRWMSSSHRGLKFLSGGLWPLPPTPEISEPSTSKIRPPFWLSMLGSPSLGLPDPVLHGEAKLFPTEPAASSLSLLV